MPQLKEGALQKAGKGLEALGTWRKEGEGRGGEGRMEGEGRTMYTIVSTYDWGMLK